MPIRVGGRVYANKSAYMARRRKILRRRAGGMRKKYSKNPLVRMVKKIIGRSEETKYVANSPSDNAGHVLGNLWYATGQLANINVFYPAIPTMTQGTDDYQRVGNRVEPVSLAVSLRIGFNPQDVAAQSLLGVIYYGTDRAGKTWNNVHPLQTAAILDNGNGANTIWGGVRADLTKPLDKKLVTFKRIVFRLSKTAGIQNSDLSGASVEPGNYSTSNGMSEKTFLLKFKVPKHISYLQNVDTFPQNYAPMFGIGFCHADGSALTADDANLVNVTSRCHLYYKDA